MKNTVFFKIQSFRKPLRVFLNRNYFLHFFLDLVGFDAFDLGWLFNESTKFCVDSLDGIYGFRSLHFVLFRYCFWDLIRFNLVFAFCVILAAARLSQFFLRYLKLSYNTTYLQQPLFHRISELQCVMIQISSINFYLEKRNGSFLSWSKIFELFVNGIWKKPLIK